MKIYNSLTRKKEEFIPLNPPYVNMYTCGVTAYDDCHIGHARSLYIFNVIRNYLGYKGFKVNFARNITDIDDKIINRANELKQDWRQLVKKYIDSYNQDLKLLSVDKGILDEGGEEPRATKNIDGMIKYIAGLIDKGYAYESEGNVYFSVRKFSGYGKLSGQSIDQMLEGVRVEPDEKKKDSLDFALWKRSKENEPSWDSPWGKGRPGWHIECSVMSQKFLKTYTLDIHAGGRDLIFPHHENEIAQAEAFTGKPFARYWIHHGLLTINSQKMAKSLGNFITIKDALKKYNPDALKIFYLQAHYSSALDFSENNIDDACSALERFNIFFNKAERSAVTHGKGPDAANTLFKNKIDELDKRFTGSMDDDFNTPQALASLFDMLKEANKAAGLKEEDIKYAYNTIKRLGSIFGLFLKEESLDPELKAYVETKIRQRGEAKKAKDFARADSIRKELNEKGIIIEDTPKGTTWRKN